MEIRLNIARILICIPILLPVSSCPAQTVSSGAQTKGPDLEELNRQISNPLSRIWSLAFQNDTDAVTSSILSQQGHINVATFQPILPMPLKGDWTFFARPVLPLETIPRVRTDVPLTFDGHTTGMGDMILASGVGKTKTQGISAGGGVTFIFPTASRNFLGQGKYQAGPAALVLYTGKKWELGTLVQQWWSIAGSSNRQATNHMNAQYFIIYSLPRHWEIRTSPNVTVNWRASEGNKLTFPVGTGVGKLAMLGPLPVKLIGEFQYDAARPSIVGAAWGMRFGMNFIIPNPFAPITKAMKP